MKVLSSIWSFAFEFITDVRDEAPDIEESNPFERYSAESYTCLSGFGSYLEKTRYSSRQKM